MSTISEADSRSMIRLLGETAAIQGGHAEMKRFLMNGLCDLIGADAWVWTLSIIIVPGAPQTYAGFIHGGFDERRFTRFLTAVEHPAMAKATSVFFRAVGKGSPVTMIRDEIDPKGLAFAEGVRQCWEEADIGSLMMSAHPLDSRSLSGLGIYRRFSDPPFSEREKEIAHIVLTEVPWLHALGWPEDRGTERPRAFSQTTHRPEPPPRRPRPEIHRKPHGYFEKHRRRLRPRSLPPLRRPLPASAHPPVLQSG